MESPETKKLFKAKDLVNKTKQQPTEWEKIFSNPTSDRGLISKIYKEVEHDRNIATGLKIILLRFSSNYL